MQNIIVLGASAGGVEAMTTLVRQLPANLNAALFVVIHFPAYATSVLPHVLSRAGNLPAHHATDGEEVRMGHIYIAPPDWHMMLDGGKIRLTRGPMENRHRPAIDPLFRSAALEYRERTLCIVLSGLQDDGTAGLYAVKSCGGTTVCQDPAEATYPDMPRNAIEQVGVDHILKLEEIAEFIVQTAVAPQGEESSKTLQNQLNQETEIAALNWKVLGNEAPPGKSSTLACPDCGGVLWEVQNGDVLRYRCRVGHAYSPHELLNSQEKQVEQALWTALRALEERASLLHRMAERARDANRPHASDRLSLQEEEVQQRVELLHSVLNSGGLAVLNTVTQEPPPLKPAASKAESPPPPA